MLVIVDDLSGARVAIANAKKTREQTPGRIGSVCHRTSLWPDAGASAARRRRECGLAAELRIDNSDTPATKAARRTYEVCPICLITGRYIPIRYLTVVSSSDTRMRKVKSGLFLIIMVSIHLYLAQQLPLTMATYASFSAGASMAILGEG